MEIACLFLDCAALLLAAVLLRLPDGLRHLLFTVLVGTAVWEGIGIAGKHAPVVILLGASA